jgi:hypothetical protein
LPSGLRPLFVKQVYAGSNPVAHPSSHFASWPSIRHLPAKQNYAGEIPVDASNFSGSVPSGRQLGLEPRISCRFEPCDPDQFSMGEYHSGSETGRLPVYLGSIPSSPTKYAAAFMVSEVLAKEFPTGSIPVCRSKSCAWPTDTVVGLLNRR